MSKTIGVNMIREVNPDRLDSFTEMQSTESMKPLSEVYSRRGFISTHSKSVDVLLNRLAVFIIRKKLTNINITGVSLIHNLRVDFEYSMTPNSKEHIIDEIFKDFNVHGPCKKPVFEVHVSKVMKEGISIGTAVKALFLINNIPWEEGIRVTLNSRNLLQFSGVS